ncbi:hypothetical protein Nepgr_029277 [Nepenthes gracilis]|uniref:Bet v I/Major latex protein domain-containing protein n=1 Tax=Nepenthes gracilis TaxID=150966 RepID=A0AAD3Y4W8_NEPGR|nr:hypothetical protein Nepgr_029277 [Nepenthes gracilis]
MGLTGKLVAELELRSSGDLFYDMISNKPHHISKASPRHVQGCNLHAGKFGAPGSVVIWNYKIDGKACVGKDLVEVIDVKNKSITFKVIEGDLMNKYKFFKITINTAPMAEFNMVKWTLEYEKLYKGVDEPIKLFKLLINITKDIEVYHLQA